MLLVVPARLRKGDANSPPPISAFLRLQRVGLDTRTSGSSDTGSDGNGYGGWKLGEGIRGLALRAGAVASSGISMVDDLIGCVDGPACEAVGALPLRLESEDDVLGLYLFFGDVVVVRLSHNREVIRSVVRCSLMQERKEGCRNCLAKEDGDKMPECEGLEYQSF